jgi:hypothetical protein
MNFKDKRDISHEADVPMEDAVEDEYYDEDNPRRTGLGAVWRVIKTVVTVLVFAVSIMFIARSCSYRNTSTLDSIVPNEALVQSGGAEAEYLTHKLIDNLAPQGYFYAYSMVYAPEAHQLQITVRYNISVYDYTLVEDGHEYAYALKYGDTEIDGVAAESYESGRYVYRRLVFDGVDITDETSLVMKNGDTGEEYADITIHYAEQEFTEYKLSAKEKGLFE